MTELEKLLLLALSVLVARQRALAFGEADPGSVAAWLEPERFEFAYAKGAHRCRIGPGQLPRFQAATLSLDRQGFVSPIPSIRHHLKLLEAGEGAYEAKLLPDFVQALGLADHDPVRAWYSPWQILFSAASGFFDPDRERWHAYAGRVLAERLPQAQATLGTDATRVAWPGGTLELARVDHGVRLSGRTPALEFGLDVRSDSFELHLRSDEPRGLMADLMRLRSRAEHPVGIDLSFDGEHGLTVRGSA